MGSSDAICRCVKDLLKVNMALIVVDMARAPPDWHMDFVQQYGIPTSLVDAKGLQATGSLRDVSMGLERHVIEACEKAVGDGRPITGRIDRVFQDARVVASGIVVPDPSAKKAWCVILCEVHSISAVVQDVRFDDIDLSIIQLLREGLSARKVGNLLELSPRTVEHRIERMKARAGMKSIVPLLTMRM
ncbi:hypothetical protein AYO27_13320 [Rhizobium sp. GHKF11]|nr:hypothetical protein AYO27_13320 [Rhizobium sp. GHKF11]